MVSSGQKGFSLIELMIVLAIIGILAAVIIPNQSATVNRASRGDGMGTLLDVMRAQENHFANDFTYTTDLTDLNLSDPYVSGDYSISASKCDDGSDLTACVKLTATAQGGQAADGNLTLNSRGEKTHNGTNKWIK
ncbi:prepilin-type N-terminal cleavage/methylation domain-containing protein [Bermanella marisrubri]|uniref:Uncharacterized protein n=1 Tax=Bermanella marisrubri TaxID=207949 RepID=Q1MYS2_9GAMM|nr:type IV pilin protein [Bermanella marisrubri]EAT11134.1 hypothetical protein RED65_05049 [Oceanobacter sp. RED65] [Bermanella marisrubri]QIZ83458.1 prepilin-type N-terminal cleavage/methylation domain-containing protein [Bermanella marisrubri]